LAATAAAVSGLGWGGGATAKAETVALADASAKAERFFDKKSCRNSDVSNKFKATKFGENVSKPQKARA
jgi:hypothetical protein